MVAPMAYADDGIGYLDALGQDLTARLPAGNAIGVGRGVCDNMRNGMSPASQVTALVRSNGITSDDAGSIIGAAALYLCPDQLHRLDSIATWDGRA